jgi:hypothetical protein
VQLPGRQRYVTSRRWNGHTQLLTDENLRIRFALDRIETVAEMCSRGVDLTCDEIDLLCQTDARLWFMGDDVRGEWH